MPVTEALESEAPVRIEYARPDRSVKPVYLLADSQLMFWKPQGRPFMESVGALIDARSPTAAYVGASNGDDPAYYSIFEAAMDDAGIADRRMIPSELEAEDLAYLDQADLILLSGGDVELGWRAFERNGLKQILMRRYYEGALLMGISAGAVQLGLAGWSADGPEGGTLIDTLRLLPHLIGAHEEKERWRPLKQAVGRMGGHARGYGIPGGGGFVYHPDHTIEPLRQPLLEFRLRGDAVEQSLLLPGDGEADEDEAGNGEVSVGKGDRGDERNSAGEGDGDGDGDVDEEDDGEETVH